MHPKCCFVCLVSISTDNTIIQGRYPEQNAVHELYKGNPGSSFVNPRHGRRIITMYDHFTIHKVFTPPTHRQENSDKFF